MKLNGHLNKTLRKNTLWGLFLAPGMVCNRFLFSCLVISIEARDAVIIISSGTMQPRSAQISDEKTDATREKKRNKNIDGNTIRKMCNAVGKRRMGWRGDRVLVCTLKVQADMRFRLSLNLGFSFTRYKFTS